MSFPGLHATHVCTGVLRTAQAIAVSTALAAAALASIGAFDVTVPPVAPPQLELSDADDRGETSSTQMTAIFYLVDSQANANALEAAIARDWPELDSSSQAHLSIAVFAAGAPENAPLIEMLTASDWTAELGRPVTVVDLREAGHTP
jgi:hypothetical protein